MALMIKISNSSDPKETFKNSVIANRIGTIESCKPKGVKFFLDGFKKSDENTLEKELLLDSFAIVHTDLSELTDKKCYMLLKVLIRLKKFGNFCINPKILGVVFR